MTSDGWVLEGFDTEPVEVTDQATLDAVLDRWHEELTDDPRIVGLIAPAGKRSLSIGLGEDETVLDWIDEDDQMAPYLTSLGSKKDDGSQVIFKFSNTFSYFDPSVLLPMDEARAALVEFYETGARPAAVCWQSLPEGYEYVDGRYIQRDGSELPPPKPSPVQPEMTPMEHMAAYRRKARHGHGGWVPVDGGWTVHWSIDSDQDIFERAIVGDVAELDELLHHIDVLRREDFRAGMAEVVSPKGDILGIALGRPESVLHWIPVNGGPEDDLTSVGSNDAPENTFHVQLPESAATAIAQFPLSALIPIEDAQAGVKQFFETGALPDGIRWRTL